MNHTNKYLYTMCIPVVVVYSDCNLKHNNVSKAVCQADNQHSVSCLLHFNSCKHCRLQSLLCKRT